MTWIRTIPFDEATGKLKTLYQRITGPNSNVDNIMQIHSLRPHTMEGHLALYKYVLHHSSKTLPVWYLESLGVYVSLLNDCEYCAEHHYAGLKRLLGDDHRALGIHQALENNTPEDEFDGRELEGMRYTEALTLRPSELIEEYVKKLRAAGFDDGEILEINQVVSYFCYANRTVLGLGVTTQGDVLGLSPSSDDAGWAHR